MSTRYELPGGAKVFGKAINADPEKYFTKDIMEQLEKVAPQEFLYGDYVREENTEDQVSGQAVAS